MNYLLLHYATGNIKFYKSAVPLSKKLKVSKHTIYSRFRKGNDNFEKNGYYVLKYQYNFNMKKLVTKYLNKIEKNRDY